MIKYVIPAIPSYATSCFLLLKKLCDKLNSYTSNFCGVGIRRTKAFIGPLGPELHNINYMGDWASVISRP